MRQSIFPFLPLVIILFVVVALAVGLLSERGLERDHVAWDRERFPLKVFTHTDDVDSTTAKAVAHEAIEHANAQLGFTAFDSIDLAANADVELVFDVPRMPTYERPFSYDAVSEDEYWNFYQLSMDDDHARWTRCYGELYSVGDDRMLVNVVQHVLGHCLNLAHDRERASIMSPPTLRLDRSGRFTERDVELLRGMYGRQL